MRQRSGSPLVLHGFVALASLSCCQGKAAPKLKRMGLTQRGLTYHSRSSVVGGSHPVCNLNGLQPLIHRSHQSVGFVTVRKPYQDPGSCADTGVENLIKHLADSRYWREERVLLGRVPFLLTYPGSRECLPIGVGKQAFVAFTVLQRVLALASAHRPPCLTSGISHSTLMDPHQ